MPSENLPFTPSSILFRPHQMPPESGIYDTLQVVAFASGIWWRRRVPPPGPNGLLRQPFIAIVSKADSFNI